MSGHFKSHFIQIFKDCLDKINECVDICKNIHKSCISNEKPIVQCVSNEGKCVINFDLLIAECEKCIDHCNLHLRECNQQECKNMCDKIIFACSETIKAAEECLIHCENNDTEVAVNMCGDFVEVAKRTINELVSFINFMN